MTDARFSMLERGGRKHLWTREKARDMREALETYLSRLGVGDVLVLDLKGIEVFDFSFANEFFGKTMLGLAREHPGRFVVVEGLNDYTRENLANALTSLGLCIVEHKGKKYDLLGKVHATDEATFSALLQAKGGLTASVLSEQLRVNLTAMNERLGKLMSLGLVRREKAVSPAGREQFEYSTLR